MCGIVGYAGKTNVIKNIMTGLKSLEYRGYDSSGIAYLDKNNNIKIYKKVGQIKNLDQILNYEDEASLGISHTRWATHGGVTDTNAHPHNQGKITLVHNGIIENYEELKKELEKEGYNFKSSTDSEVAAALIDKLYKENKDMLKTLVILKDKLKGSYAFNIINSDIPNKIYGIRKDVPLIVGVSDHGNMFASDIPAILHVTNKYIVLNNNEIVELEQDNIKYYNSEGKEITKEVKEYAGTIDSISKNGYDHFMLKEINEESEVVKNILN